MPFKFIPEMADRCGYRPGRCITQGTNGITFYFSLYVPKKVDVAHLALSLFDIQQDLFHPAGSIRERCRHADV